MDGEKRVNTRQALLAAGGLVLSTVLIGGMYALSPPEQLRVEPSSRDTSVTVAQAERQPKLVVLPALSQVYLAYEKSEETAIYNELAKVAAGDALTELYLQKRQSIVDNGLDGATQKIHRLDLVDASAKRDGAGLEVLASWQVIGTVGHQAHTHVRGNAYSADLAMLPIDGAWRITGFTLRDIDPSLAGSIVDSTTPVDALGLVPSGQDLVGPVANGTSQ
jgi:hypothetical protein